MLTSYHNHTTWSDGTTSIAEMIAAAREAGLDEIGVSDHYVLTPDGKEIEWTMPLASMGEYVAAVREHMPAQPTLRLGIEADYFPETIDVLRDRIELYPFDYVIGSVHFLGEFPIDSKARWWQDLTPEQRDEKWVIYWERITEMARSGVFDFAAHLDLPKKFGHRPTREMLNETTAALDAIAAAGMAIEINTSGWSLPAREAYPTLALLRAARDREIPLLINADAHRPAHLTYAFERARELARDAGFSELVRYKGRERFTVPL